MNSEFFYRNLYKITLQIYFNPPLFAMKDSRIWAQWAWQVPSRKSLLAINWCNSNTLKVISELHKDVQKKCFKFEWKNLFITFKVNNSAHSSGRVKKEIIVLCLSGLYAADGGLIMLRIWNTMKKVYYASVFAYLSLLCDFFLSLFLKTLFQ